MNAVTRISIQQPGKHRALAGQTGATMVEFALVIPFALLLVLGIIQLGLMYSAKSVLNEGAFMAARAGATENAQLDKMTEAMHKALIPFYQDTSDTTDFTRLANAANNARNDTDCNSGGAGGGGGGAGPCFLKVEILNPTPAAFADFGITTSASPGHTMIPNDNLEYRPHDLTGTKSGLSIQDANALKIKVTYGYELKVPLMQSVFKAIMCATDSGIEAFGRGDSGVNASSDDCSNFYGQGRVPLVAYATVQMQTPAWQNN
jgi:hypothetical protein